MLWIVKCCTYQLLWWSVASVFNVIFIQLDVFASVLGYLLQSLLSSRQRLDFFICVCHALSQYAHDIARLPEIALSFIVAYFADDLPHMRQRV